MLSLTEKLNQTIKLLGRDNRSISRVLSRFNCRGEVDSLKKCPLARYLIGKGFTSVTVFPTAVLVGEGDERICFNLDEPITNWINDFDQKRIKHLIRSRRPTGAPYDV
jgi:hypothetical protein